MTSLDEVSTTSSPSGRPGERGSRDEAPPRAGARLLVVLVEAYRIVLSPLIGGFCRFTPSCSLYAQEALVRHGALKGSALAARRLLRCHPFNPGGFDPVP
jgi:putative membrane protein insertion efficiency factor